MLFKFFTFSIALLTADIFSDIFTANDFFSRGHFYWGIFTIVPIFAPFFARVVLVIANLTRCWKRDTENNYSFTFSKERFAIWKNDLIQLFWHFPLLQPVRLEITFEDIVQLIVQKVNNYVNTACVAL